MNRYRDRIEAMRTKMLADYFLPNNYQLKLSLNTNEYTVNGTVVITGTLLMSARNVVLHAVNLKIKKIDIQWDNKAFYELKWLTNSMHNQLDIQLPNKLPENASIQIYIEYSLKITKTMQGIYPSFYELSGKKKSLISTQFESHHAREAFPCIDEPIAKATFDLELTTLKNLIALSNTSIKGEDTNGKSKTTIFHTTPKMSTYLLAFVVGELTYIEKYTKNKVRFRVYATNNNKNRMDFALETGVKVLDFYNKYFSIPYPLEKCDMVAIPEFASGAMENWGLITYRESALLIDKLNSSLPNRQWVALVVAHELAHQWFGNLVTMHWWDDLWLNEGFASWIEYYAIDKLFPEWNMWSEFVSDDYLSAITDDSLINTHPIQQSVTDPREINEIFDNITYRKGSSVIRMLNNYMGDMKFRSGIRTYIKNYQYKNAKTKDLWQSLEIDSGLPIQKFMSKWTKQKGYPVVKWSINNKTLSLSQSQFVLSPLERKRIHTRVLWPIPISMVGHNDNFLFAGKNGKRNIKSKSVVKLNANQTGFYRVAYDSKQIEALSESIHKKEFSVSDKAGLINDISELVRAGYTETDLVLEFIRIFNNEQSSPVWTMLANFMGNTWNVMGTEKFYDLFKPYGRSIVNTQLTRLGWKARTSEDHFDTLLRPTILALAIKYDDLSAQKTADTLFIKWKKGAKIDPDIRKIVYSHASRSGGKNEFNSLFTAHNNEDLAEEKRRLASGITCTRDTESIDTIFKNLLSDHIKPQDLISWIFGLYANRYTRERAWEWQKANWTYIINTFGDGHLLQYFIQAPSVFSTKKMAQDVKDFYNKTDLTGINRTLDQTIETILIQDAWKNRDYKNTIEWLKWFNAR